MTARSHARGAATHGVALTLVLAASLAPISPAPCPDGPLLPAYAHNDYRNEHPLADALALGYRGAEVDLFLSEGALLVGHDRSELRRGRTLDRLYLDPLLATLRRCGRILPGEPFLLTIEIKRKSLRTFEVLLARLESYPQLFRPTLDGREPPVSVVLVGWWPARGEDGPEWPGYLRVQRELTSGSERGAPGVEDPIGLVTLDYRHALRWRGRGAPSTADEAMLARASRAADSLGVPLRVHHVPGDQTVYKWLLRHGVDLIGVTDLEAARSRFGGGE